MSSWRAFRSIVLVAFAWANCASAQFRLDTASSAALVKAGQDCLASLTPAGLDTVALATLGWKRGDSRALVGIDLGRATEVYSASGRPVLLTRSAGGPASRDCMIVARLADGTSFDHLIAAFSALGGSVLDARPDQTAWSINQRILSVQKAGDGSVRILAFYPRQDTK